MREVKHMKTKKQRIHHAWKETLCLLFGALVYALGYEAMIAPLSLILGGATGLGTVMHFLWKMPVGAAILLVNLPLLIWGGVLFGPASVLRTVIGVLSTSFFLETVSFSAIPLPPLAGAVFGGAFTGVGIGIMLFYGYTTGGSELAASLVLHRGHGRILTVGRLVFLFDTAIVLVASLLLGKTEFLPYSVLLNFCFSLALDVTLASGAISQNAHDNSKNRRK